MFSSLARTCVDYRLDEHWLYAVNRHARIPFIHLTDVGPMVAIEPLLRYCDDVGIELPNDPRRAPQLLQLPPSSYPPRLVGPGGVPPYGSAPEALWDMVQPPSMVGAPNLRRHDDGLVQRRLLNSRPLTTIDAENTVVRPRDRRDRDRDDDRDEHDRDAEARVVRARDAQPNQPQGRPRQGRGARR